jgi:hypothetical protein
MDSSCLPAPRKEPKRRLDHSPWLHAMRAAVAMRIIVSGESWSVISVNEATTCRFRPGWGVANGAKRTAAVPACDAVA